MDKTDISKLPDFGEIQSITGWKYPDAPLVSVKTIVNMNIVVLDCIQRTSTRDPQHYNFNGRKYLSVAFTVNAGQPQVFNVSSLAIVDKIMQFKNQGKLPGKGKVIERQTASGRSYYDIVGTD